MSGARNSTRGAITVSGDSVELGLHHVVLSGNAADSSGGGSAVSVTDTASVVLDSCVIRGDTAWHGTIWVARRATAYY